VRFFDAVRLLSWISSVVDLGWSVTYVGRSRLWLPSALFGPAIEQEPLAALFRTARISARVRKAIEHLDQAYSDPRLRLHAVAKAVGLSAHHLSRLIKKETGSGFRAHLIRKRISEARRYLLAGMMSVKEIAAAVGYDSTSSFDREFRRVHGCSPTAWRRSVDDAQNDRAIDDASDVARSGDNHQHVDQSHETSTSIDCAPRNLRDRL